MNYIKYSLVLLLLYGCSQSKNEKTEYLDHVGDIAFDPAIDSKDFQPCHGDLASQYYAFGEHIQYEGEKRQMIRDIEKQYDSSLTGESGYVSIRFIVNCEGQAGRFRVRTMDENYVHKDIDKRVTTQLVDILRSLKGWKAGEYEQRYYDYYQYLTFKIESGKIVSIIP